MNKNLRLIQTTLLIFLLVGAGAIGGYLVGYRTHPAALAEEQHQANFDGFWDAWDILNANYFGDINDQDRVDGAISGMVASLGDPYTIYMNKEQDELFRTDLQGSFGGIGVELVQRDGAIIAEGVIDGGPAQKAGVLPHDVISEIDGATTQGMNFAEAISKIRGAKGSAVVLTLIREGATDVLKISVVRDTITIKSVTTDTLGTDKDVAYIKLAQFGDDTTDLVKTALRDAVSSNKKGIIIDLRNNPGGYLSGAADVIGMVIPEKVQSDQKNLQDRITVLERDKKGKEKPFLASTQPIAANLPIVVLVNGNSASASEIVAGALKDYKRATLVGAKTFGKGSVQNLLKIGNGGSIKVTIAKWFTPLGNGIDKTGIEPDVVVELPANTNPAKDDAQVQRALEVLAGQ